MKKIFFIILLAASYSQAQQKMVSLPLKRAQKLAKYSKTLKHMLNDVGLKNKPDASVTIPHISPISLALIQKMLPPYPKRRTKKSLFPKDESKETLGKLSDDINYLDIPQLAWVQNGIVQKLMPIILGANFNKVTPNNMKDKIAEWKQYILDDISNQYLLDFKVTEKQEPIEPPKQEPPKCKSCPPWLKQHSIIWHPISRPSPLRKKSPDKSLLAIGNNEGVVKIIDNKTQVLLFDFNIDQSSPAKVTVVTPRIKYEYENEYYRETTTQYKTLSNLQFSPDSTILALTVDTLVKATNHFNNPFPFNALIELWHIPTAKKIKQIAISHKPAKGLYYTPYDNTKLYNVLFNSNKTLVCCMSHAYRRASQPGTTSIALPTSSSEDYKKYTVTINRIGWEKKLSALLSRKNIDIRDRQSQNKKPAKKTKTENTLFDKIRECCTIS